MRRCGAFCHFVVLKVIENDGRLGEVPMPPSVLGSIAATPCVALASPSFDTIAVVYRRTSRLLSGIGQNLDVMNRHQCYCAP
jgi:hypothetical protein